jgi:nucleotide-binding universal stress UspA family protein
MCGFDHRCAASHTDNPMIGFWARQNKAEKKMCLALHTLVVTGGIVFALAELSLGSIKVDLKMRGTAIQGETIMTDIRCILHPTDFSDCAETAFHLACALARERSLRLIVLHVVPPPLCHGELLTRQPPDSYYRQMEEWLRRLRAKTTGVDVRICLEDGDPCEVILRTAEEEHCDLIVLGTHGRTGLPRAILGSIAEQVLRRAPCPVLTMRASLKTPVDELVPVSEPVRS